MGLPSLLGAVLGEPEAAGFGRNDRKGMRMLMTVLQSLEISMMKLISVDYSIRAESIIQLKRNPVVITLGGLHWPAIDRTE